MLYGYCSVSTYYQNIDTQKSLILSKYPDSEIYTEERSSSVFNSLLEELKEGDILIVTDIIKLYTSDGFTEKDVKTVFNSVYRNYESIFSKGADIIVINDPYLDSSFFRKVITKNHVDGRSTAEMTASDILEGFIYKAVESKMDKENLRRNRITDESKKKHFGNKKGTKYNTKKSQPCKDFIKKNLRDFGGSMTNQEIIEELRIGRNTFFKYKAELLSSLSQYNSDTKTDIVSLKTEIETAAPSSDLSQTSQQLNRDVSEELAVNSASDSPKPVKKASDEGKGKKKGSEKVKVEKTEKKKNETGDEIKGQTNIFDFL